MPRSSFACACCLAALLAGCGGSSPRKTATVKKHCVERIVGVPLSGDRASTVLEQQLDAGGCRPTAVVVPAHASPHVEYEDGKRLVAVSGCLACHKIGQNGNAGPGRELTHIGSVLSRAELGRALVASRPPMPSFKGLRPAERGAIVAFLAQLRR